VIVVLLTILLVTVGSSFALSRSLASASRRRSF
jgi:hypothetical protein